MFVLLCFVFFSFLRSIYIEVRFQKQGLGEWLEITVGTHALIIIAKMGCNYQYSYISLTFSIQALKYNNRILQASNHLVLPWDHLVVYLSLLNCPIYGGIYNIFETLYRLHSEIWNFKYMSILMWPIWRTMWLHFRLRSVIVYVLQHCRPLFLFYEHVMTSHHLILYLLNNLFYLSFDLALIRLSLPCFVQRLFDRHSP